MKVTRLFLSLALTLALIPLAAIAQTVADPPGNAVLSVLQPVLETVKDVIFDAVLPVLGAAIVAGVAWLTTNGARFIGDARMARLRTAVMESLTNGLIAAASPHSSAPQPTFEAAVSNALANTKQAYPGALKTLVAKDGPLMQAAASRLTQLIEQGLAKVAPAPRT